MNDSRYALKSLIHPLHYIEPTIATYLIYVHEPAMLAQVGSSDHLVRRGYRCHRSFGIGLIPYI
jgi:hypothetical protein